MRKLVATVVSAGVGLALVAAPQANADQEAYLDRVQERLAYLSRDQILTEGYKVCQMTRSGHPSTDAIPVIIRDLGVSVPAAAEIIYAAVVELGC